MTFDKVYNHAALLDNRAGLRCGSTIAVNWRRGPCRRPWLPVAKALTEHLGGPVADGSIALVGEVLDFAAQTFDFALE